MAWLRRTSLIVYLDTFHTAISGPLRPEMLDEPHMNYLKYGKAAFCFYGPVAWNKLPLRLRQAASVDIFKAQLKTYFYTLAFS